MVINIFIVPDLEEILPLHQDGELSLNQGLGFCPHCETYNIYCIVIAVRRTQYASYISKFKLRYEQYASLNFNKPHKTRLKYIHDKYQTLTDFDALISGTIFSPLALGCAGTDGLAAAAASGGC